jgi:hypothetical protein
LATLGDRSITITLARRKSNEPIKSFSTARRRGEFKPVRQRLMRWTQDHREALVLAEPAIPEGINNDRAVDNWRPLLAIADAAGGDWPQKAREILKALAATSDDSETGSLSELLLGDIRDIFDELGEARISFAKLIEHLVKLDLRPWGAYGKSGKPITQHQFAYCLRPFRLVRRQWREGDDRVRGYERKDIENAFERYLPPKTQCDSVTEPDLPEQVGVFDSVTPESRHTVENQQKTNNDGPCHTVTLSNRGNGATTLDRAALDTLAMRFNNIGHNDKAEADLRRELGRILPADQVEIEYKRVWWRASDLRAANGATKQ